MLSSVSACANCITIDDARHSGAVLGMHGECHPFGQGAITPMLLGEMNLVPRPSVGEPKSLVFKRKQGAQNVHSNSFAQPLKRFFVQGVSAFEGMRKSSPGVASDVQDFHRRR